MARRISSTRPAIVSMMRYRDPAVMMDWLCNAFGFEKRLIVTGQQGEVALGQLAFGDSIIMISPVRASSVDKLMAQPDEVGGIETQSCYLVVRNADFHCARAKAAGAEILYDIEIMFDADKRNPGGRGYVCRDPEGHVWNFGTYDPWRGQPPSRGWEAPGHSGRSLAIAGALAIATVASAALGGWVYHAYRSGHEIDPDAPTLSAATASAEQPQEQPATGSTGPPLDTHKDAQQTIRELRESLSRERAARERSDRAAAEAKQAAGKDLAGTGGSERTIGELEARLARERDERANAEQQAREAASQLDATRTAKTRAERSSSEANEKLAAERSARQTAERAARDAAEQLAPERSARVAAELTANELRNQLVLLRHGGSPDRQLELNEQLSAERNARAAAEQIASSARQQLAHEKALRDSAERALRQAQEQISVMPPPPSCWLLPQRGQAYVAPCLQPH